MRLIVCLLLLTALAAAQSYEKRVAPVGSDIRQTFERQPKVAVLVGVGAYPDGSGLPPLKYPARDVADLAAELEKQGYSVRQLTEGQASRGVVVRTLTQIAQVLDPDRGTLLFYFSGHGFAEKGVNYLATYGVTVDDLARDGLSLDEVERLVKGSRAKRQVLWIDACRNDPGSGARDVSRRAFAQLNAAEGMRVLYSTRSGSVSYEDDALNHGVFTYFLLRGLRGEAAGGDGLVTFQDLAGYVSESVMNYGVKTGRIQRPFDAGEASGDFLLASGTVAATAPAPPPTVVDHGPRVGDTKVNPKDGLTYVWIPPGTFTMGCSPRDSECQTDEKPARPVTISKGFWMGQTTVTQDAYQRTVGTNPSYFKGSPQLPVEQVTWDEAKRYCEAVGMRLPTEAEWEYAARAGSTASRYGEINQIAWYSENSGRKTHEVKGKQPNALGLFDMLGNVYQWTADWYADKYAGSSETDPQGAPSGQYRTLRGGSWLGNPWYVRVSLRYWFEPSDRVYGIGLRCVGN